MLSASNALRSGDALTPRTSGPTVTESRKDTMETLPNINLATSGETSNDFASIPATRPKTKDEASGTQSTTQSTWPEITDALREIVRFSESVYKGYGCDFTSEVPNARKLQSALDLARVGLTFLELEFNEEIERSLAWHRSVIEGLSPLKIEASDAAPNAE